MEESENLLKEKRMKAVNELVSTFQEGEILLKNFNVWAYSEDTLRTATAVVSHAAAMPLNDWAKYTEVVLSNKKLYLIGMTQYMDVVRIESIDLNKEMNSLEIFKHKNEEVLLINSKDKGQVQFKTDKDNFTKLYELIKENFKNAKELKYNNGKKAERPVGIKTLKLESVLLTLFGLAILVFILMAAF